LSADRPNPWARRSRTTVYENPWIQVHHDEVSRPDGSPGIYGVVHFRERAVGIVPIGDDGRILLVGQYRYTLNRYSWEIPEGGVAANESLRQGAERELAEETGYRAAGWTLLIPRFSLANSVCDQIGAVFTAINLEPGAAAPEPSEEIELRWMELDDAVALIDDGQIDDTVTQLALLRIVALRSRP
jgi:8-oxo-dGTP pyrophosphatase MutT (NUDIX family)